MEKKTVDESVSGTVPSPASGRQEIGSGLDAKGSPPAASGPGFDCQAGGEMAKPDVASIIRRLEKPIILYPGLARKVGINEALFLNQLIFWTPSCADPDGWIYKSSEDIERETTLSYDQQRRVRANLVELGLIREEYRRTEHLMYFLVVDHAVNTLLDGGGHLNGGGQSIGRLTDAQGGHLGKPQVVSEETSGGTLENLSSIKGTESTSKNTTERTVGHTGLDVPSKPKSTPTPPKAPAKKADPQIVFQDCSTAFRRHARDEAWEGTDFGELGKEMRPVWEAAVEEHGGEVVKLAVKIWMQEQTKMARGFRPSGVFMRRINEYLTAAKEQANEEQGEYPILHADDDD